MCPSCLPWACPPAFLPPSCDFTVMGVACCRKRTALFPLMTCKKMPSSFLTGVTASSTAAIMFCFSPRAPITGKKTPSIKDSSIKKISIPTRHTITWPLGAPGFASAGTREGVLLLFLFLLSMKDIFTNWIRSISFPAGKNGMERNSPMRREEHLPALSTCRWKTCSNRALPW